MSHVAPPRSILLGVGLMVITMSLIGIIDGAAKYLSRNLNGVQVAWGYFFAMLLNLVILAPLRRWRVADLAVSRIPGLQLVRAGCLVCSLSALFFSLRYLPLAEATIVSFTSPLFIVVLAGSWLGEQVGWRRWMAVGIGMLGALIVLRPGSAIFQWAGALPLVGALFFAVFNIVTKLIGHRDRPETTLFYTLFGGTLILGLAMPALWTRPTALEWLMLYAIGALGVVAHLLLVRAMTLADASTLAPLNYVRLVWAVGIGITVFGQSPDVLSLVGATIVVCSGLYVVYGATR